MAPPPQGSVDISALENELRFKELVKQRASIRGRLTTFENYIKEFKRTKADDVSEVHFNELNLRSLKMEALFSDFDKCQTNIEVTCPDHDNQTQEREATESRFYSVISSAQSLLKLRPLVPEDKQSAYSSCARQENINVKLPVIQLPVFDGNYFTWLEFHDTFESLIHRNETIPDINKFHYLRSSLQGSAALVIKSIEFSSQNYKVAWDLLCQRYNNKKILINNHLKALFKIEPITKESHKSLRYLIDVVTKNLRALTTLGQPVDHWDTLVIFMISSKLDSTTSGKWEEHRNNLSDLPLLEEFIEFLRNRADILETTLANRHEKSVPHFHKENHIKQDHKGAFTPTHNLYQNKFPKSFVTADAQKPAGSFMCPMCNHGHRIIDCESFKCLPLESKWSEALKLKLCTNCLRRGHEANNCRLGACRLCHKKHNTLLHKDSNITTTLPVTSPTAGTSVDLEVVNPPRRTLSVQSCGQVLLGTALVKVSNPETNSYHVARILLDAGSQSSFMTEDLKNKLGLVNRDPDSLKISGINNIQLTISDRCDVTISSLSNTFKTTLNCLVIPQITGQLPNMAVNVTQLNLPESIQLADPQFYHPAEIDMLLGAEIFFDILCPNKIRLGSNMPILQNTQLGWIVAGPLSPNHYSESSQTIHCNFTKEISDKLTQFWNLEELPQTKTPMSADEEFCEEHFKAHTYRLPDGRFSVLMPLKETPETALGDSYKMAAKRFFTLEKKLNKYPVLKQQYSDFIHEYESLGHLTRIKKPMFGCYLPHHSVIREGSESTKLRVVFDCAAKTASLKSLNDIQYVGPVVQDDLFHILIRFRQHKYVFTGDIQKCYRQIQIHESQRNLQLILWRDDSSKPLEVLQLNTVSYGTASAPFLSTRCLLQLALECPDPLISEAIKKDCYMDDLLTGDDSAETLSHILDGVTETLNSACFPLHKFRTNCPQIFKTSAISDTLNLSKQSSVLGVQWTPDTDNLSFKIDINPKQEKVTKRTILSNTCKIFDPLGLLSACTITLKIQLQKLWALKLSWDEVVPTHIKKTWEN